MKSIVKIWNIPTIFQALVFTFCLQNVVLSKVDDAEDVLDDMSSTARDRTLFNFENNNENERSIFCAVRTNL